MSILWKDQDNLERIPALGTREGKAEAVQGVRSKVHHQGEAGKMNRPSMRLELRLSFASMSAPWTECQRSRQLRLFLRETESSIAKINKEDEPQKELRLERERRLYALIVNELRQRQIRALNGQMQGRYYY